MANWQSILKYDPLSPLLSAENDALTFFVARDLLGKVDKHPEVLWDLPEAQKIVKKQQQDGSWKYPGGNKHIRSSENYDQIETYRILGYLVERYGFHNKNPAITRAADFLFIFQTDDGDIRGILGNQYTPYYTAGMLELLIKAGYSSDYRIEKAFRWLADIRQHDGGWAIPLRTQNKKLDVIVMHTKTLEPDRSKLSLIWLREWYFGPMPPMKLIATRQKPGKQVYYYSRASSKKITTRTWGTQAFG